MMLQLY